MLMSMMFEVSLPLRLRLRRRIRNLAHRELGFEDTRFVRFLRRSFTRMQSPVGVLSFALAIALVCGVLVHQRCLVIAFGLAVVIAAGWRLPGVIAGNADVSLHFDTDRVSEGDTASLHVRMNPREALPVLGLTIDTRLPAERRNVQGAAETWKIALPPFWSWRTGHARWNAEWQASQRGVYRLDQAVVSCSFPFRIREAQTKAASHDVLIVHPRVFPITTWPESTIGFDDYGLTTSPAKGTSGDTTGLREFRRGDDPRRVHWPQTARLGHLVVREQQRSTNPGMTVHLDAAEHFQGWRREWAVRLAASFLAGAQRLGWRCDLKLGDEASPDCRCFHDRDTTFWLDRLAGFGDPEWEAMLDSDAAADEIPTEQLQLRIVAAGSGYRQSATSQAFVVLGELTQDGQSPQPWLHFRTEAEALEWSNLEEARR